MIIGLLWMIYDIVNAPEVDDNENPIPPVSEFTETFKRDSEFTSKPEKIQSKVAEVEDEV